MKKYKWIIILINLLVVLALFNISMTKKETLLSDGTLVLLELAPVDPRSLMQGDYMTLNYAISRDRNNDDIPKRGYIVVTMDAKGVAKRVRLQPHTTPKNEGEYLINYTKADWSMNIGAESFFFQEGEGEKYENAEYGGIRIDNEGNSLLIGLYDKSLKLIQ
ncbi:GDYXXLXY domain-containing protein [Dokdonia sp.]|uniref:GDYXXLXY domain-containing protein n=1 Tax=Dokdonia sp. TaxID=2024995 RepID=UPI003266CCAA